jgi:pyrophosphatase PpaX
MDFYGPPLYETFGRFTREKTVVESMIRYYREIYTELEFNYIRIYPGVLETLQYFHENNFHIAIVTTKFSESAAPSIKHFGLNKYIDLIVALDDVTHPKPHPEPVFLAMKRLKGKSGVMIGDMPSDLVAGTNGGILTCGVGWTVRREALKAIHPDFWIDDMTELISVIQKYNEEV